MDDLHSEESKAVQKSVDGESLLSHLQGIVKVQFLNIQVKYASYQKTDVAKQVTRLVKSAMNAVSP